MASWRPAKPENNANLRPNTFTPNQKHMQQIIAVTFASISILSALVTIYWFLRLKKIYRHHLIMLLIVSDMFKAMWYFIPALVILVKKPPISTKLCESAGFFLSVGNGASGLYPLAFRKLFFETNLALRFHYIAYCLAHFAVGITSRKILWSTLLPLSSVCLLGCFCCPDALPSLCQPYERSSIYFSRNLLFPSFAACLVPSSAGLGSPVPHTRYNRRNLCNDLRLHRDAVREIRH